MPAANAWMLHFSCNYRNATKNSTWVFPFRLVLIDNIGGCKAIHSYAAFHWFNHFERQLRHLLQNEIKFYLPYIKNKIKFCLHTYKYMCKIIQGWLCKDHTNSKSSSSEVNGLELGHWAWEEGLVDPGST